jgi:hypothetical protein
MALTQRGRSAPTPGARHRGPGTRGRSRCLPIFCRMPLIIRLIIQTILLSPTGAVWTDSASNVSRPDPSGAVQVDDEHPARNRKVEGSNPTSGSNAPGQRPGAFSLLALAQSAARSRRDAPVLLSLLLSAAVLQPVSGPGKATLLNLRERHRLPRWYLERPYGGQFRSTVARGMTKLVAANVVAAPDIAASGTPPAGLSTGRPSRRTIGRHAR